MATVKSRTAANEVTSAIKRYAGWREVAAVVLEHHLLGVVVAVVVVVGGQVGLLIRRAEGIAWVGIPEVGHGPAPSI
jgi:hypothetical protein